MPLFRLCETRLYFRACNASVDCRANPYWPTRTLSDNGYIQAFPDLGEGRGPQGEITRVARHNRADHVVGGSTHGVRSKTAKTRWSKSRCRFIATVTALCRRRRGDVLATGSPLWSDFDFFPQRLVGHSNAPGTSTKMRRRKLQSPAAPPAREVGRRGFPRRGWSGWWPACAVMISTMKEGMKREEKNYEGPCPSPNVWG